MLGGKCHRCDTFLFAIGVTHSGGKLLYSIDYSLREQLGANLQGILYRTLCPLLARFNPPAVSPPSPRPKQMSTISSGVWSAAALLPLLAATTTQTCQAFLTSPSCSSAAGATSATSARFRNSLPESGRSHQRASAGATVMMMAVSHAAAEEISNMEDVCFCLLHVYGVLVLCSCSTVYSRAEQQWIETSSYSVLHLIHLLALLLILKFYCKQFHKVAKPLVETVPTFPTFLLRAPGTSSCESRH